MNLRMLVATYANYIPARLGILLAQYIRISFDIQIIFLPSFGFSAKYLSA